MNIIFCSFSRSRRPLLVTSRSTFFIALMILCCLFPSICAAQEAKKSADDSLDYYLALAEKGDAEAQAKVAELYREGKAAAQNVPEAFKWYTKAAQQGLAVAQYKLGEMYRDGQGVAKDAQEATKWFQKAADQGHQAAKGEIKKLGSAPVGGIEDLNKLLDMMR
jgi:uncharacterized protein